MSGWSERRKRPLKPMIERPNRVSAQTTEIDAPSSHIALLWDFGNPEFLLNLSFRLLALTCASPKLRRRQFSSM